MIQHNEDTYISLDNNHDKVLTDLLIELVNSFDLRGNKSHSELLKILNNCIDCIDNFDYYFNDRNDRISELLTFMFVIFNWKLFNLSDMYYYNYYIFDYSFICW